MLKFFKNLLATSVLASVAMIFLGVAFIMFPEGSLAVISNSIAIMLILYGVYGMILSFQSISVSYSLNIGTSIIALAMGVAILLNNAVLEAIIPVILGIFFIINGVTKLRYAIVLKNQKIGFAAPTTVALILVGCGVLMLMRPVFSAIAITSFLGALMIVYAVSDLVDAVFLRKHISEVEKYFGKYGGKSEPKEAEIVDKTNKK